MCARARPSKQKARHFSLAQLASICTNVVSAEPASRAPGRASPARDRRSSRAGYWRASASIQNTVASTAPFTESES